MKPMRLFACALVGLLALAPLAARAQTPQPDAGLAAVRPAPADVLLKNAQAEARRTGKTVFVRFTASWCGWCRLLEKNLDAADIRPLIEKSFVFVTLTVQENGEKKALENAGGAAVLAKLGGDKVGLPFFAALDKNGKKLIDSNLLPNAQNVGCPASPEEIAAFGVFLQKAAPKLSAAERQTILDRFTKNAPKR